MSCLKTVFGSPRLRSLVRRAVPCAIAFQILGNAAYASGDSGYQSIAYVHVEAGWFVTIGGVAAFNNPDGCGNATMVWLEQSGAGYSSIFAQVLAAQASGKQMSFWLNGCTATPWGFTVPLVYSSNVQS